LCAYEGMEKSKERTSSIREKVGEEVEQNTSKWSEIAKGLVDKLTGKDMAVTYEFDNLEIDIPKASGPGGQEIGSAKWKINGKFIISTKVQDKSEGVH
jgi:protein subunit release factor B